MDVSNKEANKVESKTAKIEDPNKRSNEPDNQGDIDDDDDDHKADEEDDDDERSEEETVVKEDLSKEELVLRIYNTITSTILPQLHKCVTKKVSL